MSIRIPVVHEAPADFEIATALADRVLVESIDWLDDDLIEHQRNWVRTSTDGAPLTWTKIKTLAMNAGIVAMGHFDGEPGLPDAKAARRAILFLREAFPDLAAITLIRDQDDQPERRQGLEQARQQHYGAIPIVVGVAVVGRENWVLSGFDPLDEAETARLNAERERLGIDPRLRSHELTACKKDQDHRSPKRALKQLSDGDLTRERRCWLESTLPTLRERGAGNGLAEYLQDVQNKLVGLIGHREM